MANNFVFDPSMKFTDPEKILFAAGLGAGQSLADFGSGSGFFSLAAAKIVGEQGAVYPVDILESALNNIAAEARMKNLRNIKTFRADLEQPEALTDIPVGSVDAVLFSNIAHQIKNRANLFAEAYRVVKTGGKLLIIDWNAQPSPIGPVAAERISEGEVQALAAKANFKPAGNLPVDIYHYGLMYIK